MNQPNANPPKKSGGIFKWVLLGCGGIVLIGAAVIGFIGYQAYKSFSTDPAKVEASAQEILKFDPPAGYRGQMAMSMMGFKMIALGSQTEHGSMIMLMTIPGGKGNQEQLKTQMNANLEKQGQANASVEQRPAEKFKVRGQDINAQVNLVTPKQGGAPMLQYMLAPDGANGDTVLLVIQGGEKSITHDWVQKFLDTVK